MRLGPRFTKGVPTNPPPKLQLHLPLSPPPTPPTFTTSNYPTHLHLPHPPPLPPPTSTTPRPTPHPAPPTPPHLSHPTYPPPPPPPGRIRSAAAMAQASTWPMAWCGQPPPSTALPCFSRATCWVGRWVGRRWEKVRLGWVEGGVGRVGWVGWGGVGKGVG